MDTQSVLQVLSTFTAKPIEPSLRQALTSAGIAQAVGFTEPAQMKEYLVAPSSETEQVLGTLVLLRIEDWLRDGLDSGSSGDSWARQELQARVREYVSEITLLSHRGLPVWFLACPSTGWVSDRNKFALLCQTYTNLLLARVRNVPRITILNWPSALAGSERDDRAADHSQRIPFTQAAFDQLGAFVGGEVARTLAQHESKASHAAGTGSPELAAYLAGLHIQVQFAPADSADRVHVGRLIRTA